jgi:predicted protein tyrosine phosphatase
VTILVSPLSRVLELVAARTPHRVISILDPDMPFPELGASYAGRHLRLTFHDVHEAAPGLVPVTDEHVELLLSFLGAWHDDESILIHCHAGIGRSTATGFVARCYRNPAASELAIAHDLRRVAPLSRPNEAVVRIADRIMRRRGRMIDAIRKTGRGLGWVDVNEGIPFELPSLMD